MTVRVVGHESRITHHALRFTSYCCAPDIEWVQDASQVLLVDAARGRSWPLQGVEAAIWDWLSLGYRYEQIARFVSLALGTSMDEAERALCAVLRGWAGAGILQASEGV